MANQNLSNVIISTIPIEELVVKIADEVERRAASKTSTLPDPMPHEPKRLYGDKAAANHIGCTAQAVGKKRRAGEIRYYTIGTRYYYYAHELDQDLRGGKHRFGELRGRRKKQ